MSEAQQKLGNETNEANLGDETPATELESATDDTSHQDTDERDTNNKKGKGFTGFIAFVALIIAIGAFVAGYKALQGIGQEQATLGNRLKATEQSVNALESGSESSRSIAESVRTNTQEMQSRLDTMAGTVNALSDKVDSSASKVESSVNKLDSSLGDIDSSIAELKQNHATIRASVNELQQNNAAITASIEELGGATPTPREEPNQDKMLVAEARHLITIANHQAQLNQNPAAAALALEAADQHLSNTADPSLLKARQIITDDIIALRGVVSHDISAIALTLTQLEQSVPELPLKDDEPATSAAADSDAGQEVEDDSGVSDFFEKIWSDIKGLVTVRRNDEEVSAALLPPGQRFFLQQNLRLKLQTARLALLQSDTQTFHDSLNTAKEWLETYFDISAANTANMLSSIAAYQKVDLTPELPDISNSLEVLDEWSSNQQNAAITTSQEVAAS